MMRCILLILDGLGDKGHACFDGRTPLQAAYTPNLDYLARISINGLYHSYIQGVALPSELAHFLMFGYDLNDFPGRGLIEAIGNGIAVKQDEVALIARIFSVHKSNSTLILQNENPGADTKTCRTLHDAIKFFKYKNFEVTFIPTKGIEGIVKITGEVSADITDSNPIYEGMPLMEITPFMDTNEPQRAIQTAKALNSYLNWCYRKLSAHPVNKKRIKEGFLPLNAVGTQRAGKNKQLMPFAKKWGLRALSVASGHIHHGLCTLLKMHIHKVQDSENPEKDLLQRLHIANRSKKYDFVHVHTKAPDVAAHTKNPQYKKTVIESLDRALSYAVHEIIPDENILFVVTADHATASTGTMIHSGEAVPLTIKGKYTVADEVEQFNEISCARGGLGQVRGKELMYLILNFLDCGKLWGLMNTPVNQPYIHGKTKPLIIE